MVVIIDNYDSFTYNLYQYIGSLNPKVKVYRNDRITIEELENMDISHFVISPGPGYPKDAGISKEVIEKLGGKVPILGVCLGHQAIGEVFGGTVIRGKRPVHGKTSIIQHNEMDLFKGIVNNLEVARYHSLVVDKMRIKSLQDKELEITAISSDGEIMGLKHKKYPIFGIQFHPESIATVNGMKMIENFLNM